MIPGVLNDSKGQTVIQGADFPGIDSTSTWAPVVVSSILNLIQMSPMRQRNKAKHTSADTMVKMVKK